MQFETARISFLHSFICSLLRATALLFLLQQENLVARFTS
uniref:Uncharacterized protein n=1 Tax=Tetraselmis sp. GSL018 TaxID=582737 RepID=A0A061QXH5_9CHLO